MSGEHDTINAHFRQQLGYQPPAPEIPDDFRTAAGAALARDVQDVYEAAEPYLRRGAEPAEILESLQEDHPEMFRTGEGITDAGRQGDSAATPLSMSDALRFLATEG